MNRRVWLLLAAWALLASALLAGENKAHAQSGCPSIVYGAVLTAGQWNACFAGKQDALGFPPVNKNGDAMVGPLTAAASTSLASGFNIPQGITPSAPNNGDVWNTSSGMFVRIAGTTIGPLSSGSSGSFAGTAPLTVSFPAGVVTYALSIDSTLVVGGGNLGVDPTHNFTWSGTNNFSGTFKIGGATVALPVSLSNGGTNAAITADNGAVAYSDASKLQLLASTGTAGLCLLSGNHAAPTWGSCTGSAAVASVSNSDGTMTISPTTGAVVSSINLAHANTWTGAQTVNLSGGALPALTGRAFQVGGVSGGNARLEFDAFGGLGLFTCTRADGTATSPTAVQAGDEICALSAWAYDGVTPGTYAVGSAINIYAAETWSSGHHGTYLNFEVVPIGNTASVVAAQIENNGGFTVGGSSVGHSQGAGTIRVDTGYYVGANQILNVFSAGTGLVFASNTLSVGIASNANVWSAAAGTMVDAAGLASAGTPTSLTDGATVNVDGSTGVNFKLLFTTHGGTRTLANPTNVPAGRNGCFWITQDATGGEGLTLGTSWMTTASAGLALSTAPNATDLVCYAALDSTHLAIAVSQLNTKH